MVIGDVIAALAPVIARARLDEPQARAFFLYGSLARGDHGAFSDVDVRVVTDGPPLVKARTRILDVEGRATHVSISGRSLEQMEAMARTASGWAWIAGFVDVAVTIDDPSDVRARLRAALARPARLESESGMQTDLEGLIEHLAKGRNALARHDHARVLRHAIHVARNARRCLVPIGPVAPAARGGELEDRALATMTPAFLDDLQTCACERAEVRAAVDVMSAAVRVAEAVLEELEALEDPPLHEPLRADLLEGRVRVLVQRMR